MRILTEYILGTAFLTLTVDDPFDEDVYMCLLDRRDFDTEENVEMMELGKSLLYIELHDHIVTNSLS